MPSSRSSALPITTATARARAGGLYIGVGADGPMYAPSERGLLVLGPPRSGKTSSVVIPNVLAARSSVFAVSTKLDVLEATLAVRRQVGRCYLFDPAGELAQPDGVIRVGWSPITASRRWDDAVLLAEAMIGAARPGGDRGDSAHWNERATALLSCVFHAGALDAMSMQRVMSSLHRREFDLFATALSRGGAELALDVLAGIAETDERELSGIWSTASGVLAAYRTEATLDNAALAGLDPEEFLAGSNTLYLVASSDHQHHAAPIVAGLLRALRSAAFALHRRTPLRGAARLLLVLDELAQIAPLHDLPALVAEGASQGVLTLACLQDLSQARSRWGVAADGFLSLFGAKLVLAGIGDVRTLGALSTLAGEREVPRRTTTVQRSGPRLRRSRSRSTATVREPRLPPSAIATSRPGLALAVIGTRPGWVRLTPYFEIVEPT